MRHKLYNAGKLLSLLCLVAFFASCSSDSEAPVIETADNYKIPANYQFPDSATVVTVLQANAWKEVRPDNESHIMRFEPDGVFQSSRNWNFGPHFFKWYYQDSARYVYLYYQLQDTTIYLVDRLELLQVDPAVLFYQVEREDENGNPRKVNVLFRKQQD